MIYLPTVSLLTDSLRLFKFDNYLNLNSDDVGDKSRRSPGICPKFWKYHKPDEPGLIEKYFQRSGYDPSVLVKAVTNTPEYNSIRKDGQFDERAFMETLRKFDVSNKTNDVYNKQLSLAVQPMTTMTETNEYSMNMKEMKIDNNTDGDGQRNLSNVTMELYESINTLSMIYYIPEFYDSGFDTNSEYPYEPEFHEEMPLLYETQNSENILLNSEEDEEKLEKIMMISILLSYLNSNRKGQKRKRKTGNNDKVDKNKSKKRKVVDRAKKIKSEMGKFIIDNLKGMNIALRWALHQEDLEWLNK